MMPIKDDNINIAREKIRMSLAMGLLSGETKTDDVSSLQWERLLGHDYKIPTQDEIQDVCLDIVIECMAKLMGQKGEIGNDKRSKR